MKEQRDESAVQDSRVEVGIYPSFQSAGAGPVPPRRQDPLSGTFLPPNGGGGEAGVTLVGACTLIQRQCECTAHSWIPLFTPSNSLFLLTAPPCFQKKEQNETHSSGAFSLAAHRCLSEADFHPCFLLRRAVLYRRYCPFVGLFPPSPWPWHCS